MYSVIAYYVVKNNIDNYRELIDEQTNLLSSLDAKGRIYIGPQGVNAQLSIMNDDLDVYIKYLKSNSFYDDAEIKIHQDKGHVFDKLRIKYKDQIVALDKEVDFTKSASYLSSNEWNEAMEAKDTNTIVVDVRNNYESEVGYFEGAIKPDIKNFREFDAFADKIAKEYDKKKTKVLMYCTGGIRCEFFSPLLKERGFEDIHQLKGGVIGYGLDKQSKSYWKGNLFVFDDRLCIPIEDQRQKVVSSCQFCGKQSDVFYNCANMDCNELFLSCNECAAKNKGCCQKSCQEAPRVRKYSSEVRPKPFRKLTKEEKIKYSTS